MKLNIFTPQWQGSGTTPELYYGAKTLKEYIELKSINFFECNTSLNLDLTTQNNILGYNYIHKQLNEIDQTLLKLNPGKIFTIGGGCGVEVPIVSYLKNKYSSLDIYWFDAHGDLNSPSTSKSKHFHGMPLRFLLDNSIENVLLPKINYISPDEVLLVGSRDLDPPELDYITNRDIQFLEGTNIDKIMNCTNRESKYAYIHLDLDVLDPKEFKNVKCPTPRGLTIKDLTVAIRKICETKEVIGMSILENTERNRNNLKKLDQIINLGINF